MILNKPKYWDKKIGIISILLFPITIIVLITNFLKKKLTIAKKFNIPIICIGNIYVGGTGKTPTSIFLGNELKKLGRNPAILRKFYDAHADEYNLIKKYFNNLILNKSRLEGIKSEMHNFDSIILDDGFQDYTIKKNLNIICFNQNQMIGNGMVLPSGPLRESIYSLKRANIILINGERNIKFEDKIFKINKNLEFFYSTYKPINLGEFKNKKLLAIAGIGNPENFFNLIENKIDITALILIGPSLDKGLSINLLGKITSKPYIEMSIAWLQRIGVNATFINNRIEIKAIKNKKTCIYNVESDWSSLSYFFSIVALSKKSNLEIGTYFSDSIQGDKKLIEIYNKLGVKTFFKNNIINLKKDKDLDKKDWGKNIFLDFQKIGEVLLLRARVGLLIACASIERAFELS